MSGVAWVLVGVAAAVVVGLLVTLALGLIGAPAEGGRRLGQRLRMRGHVYRGTELPPEVPEADDDEAPGPGEGPRPG